METTYFTTDFSNRNQCEKIFNDYKIGKYIGKGAYAYVYEAY